LDFDVAVDLSGALGALDGGGVASTSSNEIEISASGSAAGATVVAGAAAGKARNLYHRVEVEKELADVITAGTSGIMCLVSATAVEDVRLKMPEAQAVKSVPVDDETADAIKAAAAAADAEAPAAG